MANEQTESEALERPNRTCILVLGMHRSGTSALTRVVSLLGAALPKNTMGAGPGNATGHWEPTQLVTLHDQMLTEAGSSWNDWRPLDLASSLSPERLEYYRNEIRKLIVEEFGEASLFVIKDPRISRFVWLYLEILQSMNVETRAILMVRNPLSVGGSLSDRNGIESAQAWLYWLRHVIDAEAGSRAVPRSVLSYEEVLEDWRKELSPVGPALNIKWPHAITSVAEEIDAFLSPDQRHHAYTQTDLDQMPGVANWIKRAYRAITKSSLDPQSSTGELDAVAKEFESAVGIFSEALAAERAIGERLLTDERSKNERSLIEERAKSQVAMAEQEKRDEAAKSELREVLESKVANLQEETDKMHARYGVELKNQNKRIEELDSALVELTTIKSERNDLIMAVDKAQSEVKAAKSERNDLIKAVDKAQSEVKAAKSERNDLIKAVDKAQSEVKAAKSERNDLIMARDKAQSEVKAAKSERNDLIMARDKAQLEVKAAMSDRNELLTKQHDLESKLEELQLASNRQAAEFDDKVRRLEKNIEDSYLLKNIFSRLRHALLKSFIGFLPFKNKGYIVPAFANRTSFIISNIRAFLVHNGLSGGIKRLYVLGRRGELYTKIKRVLFGQTSHVISNVLPFSPEAYLFHHHTKIINWAAENKRPVTVVIPSYRDAVYLKNCVDSIFQNDNLIVPNVIISDDNSADPDHQAALEELEARYSPRLKVIFGKKNLGFAKNANRGLNAAPKDHDLVLLNSDTIVEPTWLESLQFAANTDENCGIACAKLVYPNRQIQFAGGIRNFNSPDWFTHFYQMEDQHYMPSMESAYVLFATGACIYIKQETRKKLGLLDPSYPMAFEDVDYSISIWKAGLRVVFTPFAQIVHLESPTRGRKVGSRESESKRYFWEKNSSFFRRDIGAGNGFKGRVIYVTQDVGVGGGHRVIFRHLEVLVEAGFKVELWNLAGRPNWYDLDSRIEVRVFDDYDALTTELEPLAAIKVATWWETAKPVWLASINNGLPVHHVQDIESSYYANDVETAKKALAAYRPEFNFTANTEWIKQDLADRFKLHAVNIGLGYDSNVFNDEQRVANDDVTILVAARGEPIKDFAYAKEILKRIIARKNELGGRRVKIVAFGLESHLVRGIRGVKFHLKPSDSELAALYRSATIFLSTSIHEGFCLPPLEAMASGAVTAMTDAFGNREYLKKDKNCIFLERDDPNGSADKIIEFLNDGARFEKTRKEGMNTCKYYTWDRTDQRLRDVYEYMVANPEFGVSVRDGFLK